MPRTKKLKAAKKPTKTEVKKTTAPKPKAKKTTSKKATQEPKRGRPKGSYKRLKDVDEILKLFSKVQAADGKEFRVLIGDDLYPIAENIMNDLDIAFKVTEKDGRRSYAMSYERPDDVLNLVLEELDDEFLEEGQIF